MARIIVRYDHFDPRIFHFSDFCRATGDNLKFALRKWHEEIWMRFVTLGLPVPYVEANSNSPRAIWSSRKRHGKVWGKNIRLGGWSCLMFSCFFPTRIVDILNVLTRFMMFFSDNLGKVENWNWSFLKAKPRRFGPLPGRRSLCAGAWPQHSCGTLPGSTMGNLTDFHWFRGLVENDRIFERELLLMLCSKSGDHSPVEGVW